MAVWVQGARGGLESGRAALAMERRARGNHPHPEEVEVMGCPWCLVVRGGCGDRRQLENLGLFPLSSVSCSDTA